MGGVDAKRSGEREREEMERERERERRSGGCGRGNVKENKTEEDMNRGGKRSLMGNN